MTAKRLKENYFIAMGAYATHRKEILSFDRWHEALMSTKVNSVKEIRSQVNRKRTGEPE